MERMEDSYMALIKLFLAFLQVGSLAIGGGYATIPLIQNVVFQNEWLTMQEFSDIITISQMTPGPIAVNTSTFVGIRIAGLPGAIVATFGCVITGVFLCILLNKVFIKFSSSPHVQEILKALRASSTGLILSAALTIVLTAILDEANNLSFLACLITLFALVLLRKFKVNSIYVIFLCGLIGILLYR